MRYFVLVIALFGIVPCISAQHIAVGVKVGGILTDTYSDYADPFAPNITLRDQSRAYTLGPSFDIELWKGLGVEVDALYRRIGYDYSGVYNINTLWHVGERSNSWEFPVLARYRVPLASSIHPFIVSGYARRAVFASGSLVHFLDPPVRFTDSFGGNGFVAGGGVEFGTRHLRLTPEFRYTRWGQGLPLMSGFPYFYAGQNQASILFGVSWR